MEDYVEAQPLAEAQPHKIDGEYCEVRPLIGAQLHETDDEYVEVRPLDVTDVAKEDEEDDEYAEVRPLDVTDVAKEDEEDDEYTEVRPGDQAAKNLRSFDNPSFSTKDILKMAQMPEVQSRVAQMLSKERTAPEIEKTVGGDAKSRYRERIKAMKQSRCKR